MDVTYVAEPLPHGRPVMPLSMFDAEARAQIIMLATAPERPARWIDFGIAQIESRAWYEWHWHRGIDPTKSRRSLPALLRAQIIERDGLTCRLCWLPVDSNDVHIDHIHPVALGGSDHPDNLQVTHSLCNIRKGART